MCVLVTTNTLPQIRLNVTTNTFKDVRVGFQKPETNINVILTSKDIEISHYRIFAFLHFLYVFI